MVWNWSKSWRKKKNYPAAPTLASVAEEMHANFGTSSVLLLCSSFFPNIRLSYTILKTIDKYCSYETWIQPSWSVSYRLNTSVNLCGGEKETVETKWRFIVSAGGKKQKKTGFGINESAAVARGSWTGRWIIKESEMCLHNSALLWALNTGAALLWFGRRSKEHSLTAVMWEHGGTKKKENYQSSVEGFAVKSHLKYNAALDEVIKSYLPLPLPVKLFYQRPVELIRQTVTCKHGGIIHDKGFWQSFSPTQIENLDSIWGKWDDMTCWIRCIFHKATFVGEIMLSGWQIELSGRSWKRK